MVTAVYRLAADTTWVFLGGPAPLVLPLDEASHESFCELRRSASLPSLSRSPGRPLGFLPER